MNLPKEFEKRTKNLIGKDYDNFIKALNNEQPISIRLNPYKQPNDFKVPEEKVKWCNNGYYLSKRPLFTIDPLLHAGCYYVQEASSMFLYQAINQLLPNNPLKVLDLCAAPGGKSTLLASALPKNSLLISNEYIYKRAYILAENIQKWGNPNCIVTSNAPKEIGKLKGFFDVILIDAPCSGEGMFRKDLNAINEWSVMNVNNCAKRQKEIITDIWPALKTDGIIIYSTCTYNKEEDEENARFIEKLGAENLKIKTEKDWNITENEIGYHFYPHKTKGEGFYISAFKKFEDERSLKIKINNNTGKPTKELAEMKNLIKNSIDYVFDSTNNIIQIIPKRWENEILFIEKNLKTLFSGIPLGVQKGKNIIPSAALALSTDLNLNNISFCTINLKTALQYLHTDNIFLENAPLGNVLLIYRGIPLGWVKNLGNRCNSLYPKEWRIRMNLPQEFNGNNII